MAKEPNIAKRLLEVIPHSMTRIRAEVRSCIPGRLSVPDFRILGSIYLGRNLIGDIARHHGVSQPSLSRSVGGLIQSGLVERVKKSADRRQVPLKLTKKGEALFLEVTEAAELHLLRRISLLDTQSCKRLSDGLDQLEKLFMIHHRNHSRTVIKKSTR